MSSTPRNSSSSSKPPRTQNFNSISKSSSVKSRLSSRHSSFQQKMIKENNNNKDQQNNNVLIKSVEKKQLEINQEISRPEFEEKTSTNHTIINEFKVVERDSSEKYQVNPTGINDTPREI